MKLRIKESVKRFLYETFRPRSREDYAEILTRGRGGEGKTQYPWLYSRVLLISFLIFSFLCVAYSLSNLNFFIVAFAGGIFADLTFIVLIYELYPERDLSLVSAIAALFAGGLFSSFFAYILYGISYTAFGVFTIQQPYISQIFTALIEETGKITAIIIIFALFKKRNTYIGIIVGVAVGGGFSMFENMWYIYADGLARGASGLSPAIITAIFRAFGTPFSHAAWAAAFGWAVYDKKPWKKLKTYLIILFNFTMHFFVNFPLIPDFNGWRGYPISAVTGILSFALLIYIVGKSRRSFSQNLQLSMFLSKKSNGNISAVSLSGARYFTASEKKKFAANVLSACAILMFSAMLLGPTCVFGGYERFSYKTFDSFEAVQNYIQCGLEFSPNYQRKYEKYVEMNDNYSYTWSDNDYQTVTQRQKYGEYYFRYRYNNMNYALAKDEAGDYYTYADGGTVYLIKNDEEVPDTGFRIIYKNDGTPNYARRMELQGIMLEYNDKLYTCIWISLNNSFYSYSPIQGEEQTACYFYINEKCASYINFIESEKVFWIAEYDNIPVRKIESIVFTSVFGAAFLGCGLSYIIIKLKIRRNKNVG